MQQQEIENILRELSESGLGDKAREALSAKLLEQLPGLVISAAFDPEQTQNHPILAVLAGLVLVADRFGQFSPGEDRFTVRTSWRDFLRGIVLWTEAHPEEVAKLRSELGVVPSKKTQISQAASLYKQELLPSETEAPVEAPAPSAPKAKPPQPLKEELSAIVESMRALISANSARGEETRKADFLASIKVDGRDVTKEELEAALIAGKASGLIKGAGTGRGTHYILPESE